MRGLSSSVRLNKFLNIIENDIRVGRDNKKSISILEGLLGQPYCKPRIKELLFQGYLNVGKVDKAYNIIKEHYNTTKSEKALFKLVKLLLNIGDIEQAKKYVDELDYSEIKIYLSGVISKYEGNYDDAIKIIEKLRYTKIEEDMYIELANLYELKGDIKKEKEILRGLLNTNRKHQASLRLIMIAFAENDPNLPILISNFDIDNCHHYGDLVKFERCIKYYKYMTNNLTEEELDSYTAKQLHNYSALSALQHISKRHLEANNLYKLKDNVDLNDIYEFCRNNLKHLIRKETNEIYIVKMPYNVGDLMGNDTDLLEVVVIPNTHNILTLYPIPRVGMYTKILEGKVYEKQ